MIIRNATVQDSFSIAKVHVRTWQYAYAGIFSDAYLQNLSIEKRAAEWNNILSVSTVGIVVLEVESEIASWVSFGKSLDDENLAAVSGEIYSIYVHPDHWSNGYGKQLIEQAEIKLWCN